MDLFSIWHWLVVGTVLLLVFGGRGRIPEVMGDVAKGIRAFKNGIADTTQAHTTTDAPVKNVDRELAADNNQRTEAAPDG